MDLADKTRLAKILGMLGSAFDGERASAARMIQAMAEKHKMTIDELIAKTYGASAPSSSSPPQPPPRPSGRKAWHSDGFNRKVRGHEEANENLRKLDQLVALEDGNDFPLFTEWEQQFMSDVAGRYDHDYELSDKQLNIVFRIVSKAERCGVKWEE